MPVPDFQTLMLPLLRFASDDKEHSMLEARENLAKEFNLSGDELKELLPSGRQATFANRVAWAKVYLGAAGLLHSPRKGILRISERGKEVLQNPPDRITVRFLDQYPEFHEFRKAPPKAKQEQPVEDTTMTPEEALDKAYIELRSKLAGQLLSLIKQKSPVFFESLVVNLLVRLGYGGSIKDAGQATRPTNDEGIDGIIKEDRLGLDVIYLQAKRWENVVGRPEIQKFVGALHGQRAKKGIFITTSSFSKEAIDYVAYIDPKVVLIDGGQLVEFMIDHDLGVTKTASYDVKKIDTDFFEEE